MNRIDNYRVKILKIKDINGFLLLSLPIVISLVPSIKIIFSKNWHSLLSPENLCCAIILLILLACYYICWHYSKCIEIDRNYLDEEIIAFRELTNKYEKMQDSYDDELNYTDRAVTMTVALDYVVKNLVSLLTHDNISPKSFKNALSDTFSLILKSYGNFYNLASERMTIALYFYCEKTKEFLDVESAKPKIFEVNNKKTKGRIWAENDESHICYVARRKVKQEYVFNNINVELNKPLNAKDDDNINYVSSISIPLFDCNHKKVIGVFSITSNYMDRFNRGNKDAPFISYLNRIFVDIFFNIAEIIEYILNKYFSNPYTTKQLELEILNDYMENSPQHLKDYHKQLISNLHEEAALNDLN